MQEYKHTQGKGSPLKWVPSVYFSMGLPYITISLVSVLVFQDLGFDKESIAYWTSLLVLPWSLKPFFSLLMELFGTKRSYVVLTEGITALMFGLLAATLLPQLGLAMDKWFYIAVALMGVMAVSGSMHDIAGDGIYMQELTSSEQGQWSGWQGAFYNLAKILSNGGLVYLAGYLGERWGLQTAWMTTMACCVFCLGVPRQCVSIYRGDRYSTSIGERPSSFDTAFLTASPCPVGFVVNGCFPLASP